MSKALTNKELRALLNEFDDDLLVYIDCFPAIALTRELIQVDELRHGPPENRQQTPALFISFLGPGK